MEGGISMSTLLTDLTTVCSQAITQVGVIAETITTTPILLMTVGFLFLGGCIGIFGRLLSRN